jgi:hypothetical protein
MLNNGSLANTLDTPDRCRHITGLGGSAFGKKPGQGSVAG